ncbi:MAG: hypothetical protein FWC87_11040 [Acidimicrobiaceae bacterium]|nr:hypothetical protein [Acidimicrobiaceae bacterium]
MKSREDMGADPPQALGDARLNLDAATASAGAVSGPVSVVDLKAASVDSADIGTAAASGSTTTIESGAPAASVPPQGPLRRFWAAHWRVALLVGLPAVIGIIHVWLVSYHYFVGSFDDDASYLMTAQAILHGAGLTGHLPSGASVVGAYPPGYSFLLIPLLWIWPHSFNPERVFSAVAYAAVFPLLWVYLGRRKVGDVVRFGALLLLAANPVMATFGSMVMAETSFLVLLLVLLLITEGWRPGPASRVLGPRGIAVVVAGAGLVWLKEAGLGVVVGLGLWYLLHRDWRKATAVIGGCALLLVPVLVARHVGGVPLAGSRYSQELGSYYSGGWMDRVTHVLPASLVHYFTFALPATVLPHGSPLPGTSGWLVVWAVLAAQVGVFTVLGLAISVFRYRDAAVVAIPVYAAETLLWPQVNERRVILALPIVIAWYVLGVVTAVRWLLAFVGAHTGARDPVRNDSIRASRWSWPALYRPVSLVGVGVLAAAAIGTPLAFQFPRDYLFGLHRTSSHPGGSRYMSILAAVGQPSTVVETDYESTTALFSGHLTANKAFIASPGRICNPTAIHQALAGDRAGYLLIGTVNKPGVIDSPCLFRQAVSHPSWAVRLLRTSRDQASVFELFGPGTAHPQMSNLLAGSDVSSSAPLGYVRNRSLGAGDLPGLSTVLTPTDGESTIAWSWGPNVTLDQVSVGEVRLLHGGSLSGVTLEVQRANGSWVAVSDAPGLVGDGGAPYLLGEFPSGTRAQAMRLVVRSSAPVVVTDANALGTPLG